METVLGRPGLKTLYLLQILLERTDEEHALNATQLREILRKEYDIEVNRQTIYSEIGKLTDYGLDIVQKEEKLGGYYVASRQFELPELKILVDVVQAARFITEKKSAQLIRKLEGLCSREEARQLRGQVVIFNRNKAGNETIYYNVDMLHSAIYLDLQITFQYADWTVQKKMVLRHGGAFYRVSPMHLVWDDENYYLIGRDENEGKTKHFRVDKMRGMSILAEHRSRKALEDDENPAAFARKTFGMFGGEDVTVRLRCADHLAGVILDRFGPDVFMKPGSDGYFTVSVTVALSRQFFGWVTAIGAGLVIESPEEVRREYLSYLEEIRAQYGQSSPCQK